MLPRDAQRLEELLGGLGYTVVIGNLDDGVEAALEQLLGSRPGRERDR